MQTTSNKINRITIAPTNQKIHTIRGMQREPNQKQITIIIRRDPQNKPIKDMRKETNKNKEPSLPKVIKHETTKDMQTESKNKANDHYHQKPLSIQQ